MKQWYAKELAKLAQVSVRTLHHYDKIGLLKPGLRQSNNYRLYSEADLLKLQQIIALKFFGFELSQIKQLLARDGNVPGNFAMQSRFLREKAESLLEASAILDRISHDCSDNKSISWKKIIELIEVYKMTQQLEDVWVKEIFTPDELKEYAQFETEMKSNSTPEQQEIFEKNWFHLVEEFKNHLHDDPDSATGIYLGKKLMEWVNNLYGKKYAHLRTKKFEKGFGEGKGLEQHGLTPDIVAWMDKAMDAYLKQRTYDILANIGKISSASLMQNWSEFMDEVCGEQEDKKAEVVKIALRDEKISREAKEWLKTVFKL
ncbi:MerR family transcriptional regulator [Legionella spiritensis]|uniref:MerR family transcriptional regulator n=1 Tax=Legionella spiritensis TaxID=452 RepID=A0A0W0Z8Q9_LEGSP|nr:MerR family transcriptional regulator [Legionella spiritensis]KTD65509.1 MerR family transcriptional regulator [Legionella spiritensis]SNV36026.1 MerR family transcriptional regulator [Legionella spiritensis]